MNDFTGSHRCKWQNIISPEQHIGLIVVTIGEYSTVIYNENTEKTEVVTGKNAITIFDSLPIVELCTEKKSKRCFGVISNVEPANLEIIGTGIGLKSAYTRPENDQRIEINGVGEGAIWVCNIEGNIYYGDYITTSIIPGYGEVQNDDILHNYTVAKATCNVDFTDITILETKYQIRFLETNGTIITKEMYELDQTNRYIAVFIGCSYHCS